MKKLLFIILSFVVISLSGQNVYISPSGNDTTGDGSIGSPYFTPEKAFENVGGGDTIFARGGTYYSQGSNVADSLASGSYGSPTIFMSYPGEWAVFDCSAHCGNGASYNSWLSIQYAEHIHIKNMEIKNVYQCSGVNSAAISFSYSRNLEFHHVIIHDLSAPRGYGLGAGAWQTWTDNNPAITEDSYWLSSEDTTRWINCDVYNTCDTLGGGNAGDGWKVVFYGNNYVEWDGCRAWNFSDDGLDPNSIDGAEFVVKNSWFMSTEKYEQFDIEGNGVKFTALYDNFSIHSDQYPFLKLWDNIFADNPHYGVYDNLYVGGYEHLNSQYIGNAMVDNGNALVSKTDPDFTDSASTNFVNNLTYNNTAISSDAAVPATGRNNTFSVSTIEQTTSVTPWDFLSIDKGELTKPRQSDGSLPEVNYLKLRNGSQLINAGSLIVDSDSTLYTRDSLGVTALAPDIGPWEYTGFSEDTNEDILSFTFPNQSGYSTYDTVNNEVRATIYYANTSTLSNLSAIILPSDGDTIVGGYNTARDFSTQPVTVRVQNIATPSEYEDWDIYIDTATASSFADIRTFYLNNWTYNLNRTNGEISIYFPPGTDTTVAKAATFTIDRGATSNISSGTDLAFNGGTQEIVITAEDGVTQKTFTLYLSSLDFTNSGGRLGYTIPFRDVRNTSRTFYSRYIAAETGKMDSIAIYHFGGTGNLLAAVYDSDADVDESSAPNNKMAETGAVAVNAEEGWQKIPLLEAGNITSQFQVGDTVYLAFAFQDSNTEFGVINDQPFNPLRCHYDSYGWGYSHGLLDPAEESDAWNFLAATHVIYETSEDPTPSTNLPKPLKIGNGVLRYGNKTIVKKRE